MTPYRLKLKKVSKKEQELLRAVYSFLPATGARDTLSGLSEVISRQTGEKFSISLESVHYERFDRFLSKLPQNMLGAVVGLAPLNEKAILEIDSVLAELCVEKMLGGDSSTLPVPRDLTDTEQGVLQYLILQVLAQVHRLSGEDERVHFRFDKFIFMPHEVRDVTEVEGNVALLVFRARLGRHSGFIRLVLPDPFIEEGLLNMQSGGNEKCGESAHALKELKRFSYVRTALRAEVGRTTVTASDLRGLEEGDVILFDHSDIGLVDGKPEGNVILTLGSGLSGGIDAELLRSDKKISCRVIGVHKGE